jgi:exoribonuclease R
MLRFSSEDRDYVKYRIYNNNTGEIIDKKDHPKLLKLFNFDIFKINGGDIEIINSPTRSGTISGVLVLDKIQTYGKYKDKFIYKCLPDDYRLPVFLVPYTIKKGFNKKMENRYVVIKFRHWENKHPFGVIEHNLGSVSELSSFYEYQLYCKSLHTSIQVFNSETRKKLNAYSCDEIIGNIISRYNVENRTGREVISIDPTESKDFDDAFGLVCGEETSTLTIYIANVPLWLDYLDLWESFSERIATIYLPDRKIPMLPTVLSDNLCSLKEGVERFALALDICINNTTGSIVETNIKSTVINVSYNLRYDTKKQENYKLYKKILFITELLNKKGKYTDCIRSSHDVVACLMILMNNICANQLYESKMGIFRTMSLKLSDDGVKIKDPDIKKFLDIWNGSGGNYCKWDLAGSHDMLKLERYIHITSPIRRLVDLLNIIKIQNMSEVTKMNDGADVFYNKWTTDENIKMINETMRSIRKVQNSCSLLYKCTNDESLFLSSHEGYIFDKIVRADNLFQYQIYLKNIKIVKKLITCINLDVNCYAKFKIHYFMDESRLYKKLRISVVE